MKAPLKIYRWYGLGEPSEGSILLRQKFVLPEKPVAAFLDVTGLGWYLCEVNGHPLTDGQIAPLETHFKKRVMIDGYEVAPYLVAGENEITIEIGGGRFETNPKYHGWQLMPFGDKRGTFSLDLTFPDGSEKVVAIDETCDVAHGDVTYCCLFDGMTRDLTQPAPEFRPAVEYPAPTDLYERAPFSFRLFPPIEAVRVTKISGGTLFDFGENLAGISEVRVAGGGGTVTVRHAEFLSPAGTPDYRSNNRALATDRYTVGAGEYTLRPKFTSHGFRYAFVSVEGDLEVLSARLIPMRAGLGEVGGVTLSDPAMQNLHDVTVRTFGNCFGSFPMDCPQRDERQGWLGDGFATDRAALMSFDLAEYYRKWLFDIKRNQTDDGHIPVICPYQMTWETTTPEWCAGYSILARDLYLYTRDKSFLADHFDNFILYAKHLLGLLENDEFTFLRYGDWCSPRDDWSPGKPGYAGTLFVLLHLQNCDYAAKILEKPSPYVEETKRLASVLRGKYLSDDGTTFASGSLFDTAMALECGLFGKDKERAAFDKCAGVFEADGYAMQAGVLGVRYFTEACLRFGRADLLWHALHREEYPSYLQMIAGGKTTLPEFFEESPSDRHDCFGSGDHAMFGSVDLFFFAGLAGIRAFTEDGVLTVAPYLPDDLDAFSVETNVRGEAVSVRYESKILTVTAPVGTPVVLSPTDRKRIVSSTGVDKSGCIIQNQAFFTFQ